MASARGWLCHGVVRDRPCRHREGAQHSCRGGQDGERGYHRDSGADEPILDSVLGCFRPADKHEGAPALGRLSTTRVSRRKQRKQALWRWFAYWVRHAYQGTEGAIPLPKGGCQPVISSACASLWARVFRLHIMLQYTTAKRLLKGRLVTFSSGEVFSFVA